MFGLTIETTGSSTAQPMVGRVEASKRATCAADHLRATFEPRTEGGGAVKCGYKQVFVADAGTWEQNLNWDCEHVSAGWRVGDAGKHGGHHT